MSSEEPGGVSCDQLRFEAPRRCFRALSVKWCLPALSQWMDLGGVGCTDGGAICDAPVVQAWLLLSLPRLEQKGRGWSHGWIRGYLMLRAVSAKVRLEPLALRLCLAHSLLVLSRCCNSLRSTRLPVCFGGLLGNGALWIIKHIHFHLGVG